MRDLPPGDDAYEEPRRHLVTQLGVEIAAVELADLVVDLLHEGVRVARVCVRARQVRAQGAPRGDSQDELAETLARHGLPDVLVVV
jgi:hypothetical protein